MNERFVVVGDSLRALQELALFHRRQLGIPVLAITGTNGKTTTKELTARVLARHFRVAVTRGNFNNHIGVPLTLLSMTGDTEMGVVEMGAGAQGEIALLCSIARPDYGLITNVGRAHLEGFGSEEGVRRGKGELYDYLAVTGGVAFHNSEDAVLREMIGDRSGQGGLQSIPYPVCEAVANGAVRYRGRVMPTQLVGDYNRQNISAAIAVGEYFGVSEDDIAAAISSYEPDNRRSQRIVTARNTVIADCYNANPSSMAAAISNFAHEAPSSDGSSDGSDRFPSHKAVILGDMLELGDHSAAEHEAIVRQLTGTPWGLVMLVGENFTAAAVATEGMMLSFPSYDALEAHLQTSPLAGYTILVKGSRGVGLERALEWL